MPPDSVRSTLLIFGETSLMYAEAIAAFWSNIGGVGFGGNLDKINHLFILEHPSTGPAAECCMGELWIPTNARRTLDVPFADLSVRLKSVQPNKPEDGLA